MEEPNIKQRIVGTIILLFIIVAVLLLILSFSGGNDEQTPTPDQNILPTTTSVSASQDQNVPPAVTESSLNDQNKVTSSVVTSDVASSVDSTPTVSKDNDQNKTILSSTPQDTVNEPTSSTNIPGKFGQVSTPDDNSSATSTVVTDDNKVVDTVTAKPNVDKSITAKTSLQQPKETVVSNEMVAPAVSVLKYSVVKKHVHHHRVVKRKVAKHKIAKHRVIKRHHAKKHKKVRRHTFARKVTARKIKSGWSIKVASFASPLNAKKMMRRLQRHGFRVYTVLRFSENHGVLTQVLVGPQRNKYRAIKLLRKIKSKCGVRGILVRK